MSEYTKKSILTEQSKIKYSNKELLEIITDKIYDDINENADVKKLNLSKRTVRRFLLRNLAFCDYTRHDLFDSLIGDFTGIDPGEIE